MTDYFVNKDDGSLTKTDHPPDTGFYYAQDGPGGAVTLYEVDPWGGDPRRIDQWDSGDVPYEITESGKAYGQTTDHHGFLWMDSTTHADMDDRRKNDDILGLADTFGPDYVPKDSDDLIKDDGTYISLKKEDGTYDDSWLRIEKPIGTDGVKPSRQLVLTIERANLELNYLTHQIGTGDINKPKFLMDPKGDKALLDDGLNEPFVTRLHEAAGQSYEAEGTLITELATMKEAWMEVDKSFADDVLLIDDYNHTTFKSMVDKISAVNEGIARSLIGVNEELEKPVQDANEDLDLSEVGIQHLVEEAPLYKIIRDGVDGCVTLVDEYCDRMEQLAKSDKDRYEHLVDDGEWHAGNDPASEKPKDDDDKGDDDKGDDDKGDDDKGDDDKGDGGNNGNNGNGGNNGSNNNGNSGNDANYGNNGDNGNNGNNNESSQKPVNSDDALKDLDKEFSNILGDSTQKTEDESDATDTAETGKDEKQSQVDAIKEYLRGDGESGQTGNTNAQPAVQPAANTGGTGLESMIPMMGLMSAMGGLGGNGGPFGGGDQQGREDKDDRDDDRRDRDRQAPGPGQQSPGVTTAAAPTDQGAGVQPAVTAPDAGTPPVISTPGAMVDPKLTGPDGKPLTGPGGKPLEVSQAVSDALTHQKGNPAINASTAYEGTPAAQTPERPWEIVDGAPRTGDVIAWERHSAVLINNGAGLFYIENGQVVALDQTNLDNAQYGKFQNFLHPSGLDAASATPAAPESPGLPEPKVTQSQPPAPPAVQAPKEPQAT
ncbi:hypothetical protein [Nocardia grenadensis]|uniref:hypothetical protein n=1 Tax=Nocardia grenadensis TaxID=931537 RepID=UPI000A84BE34|nr:hypothetical protein [Nocardia grenadensis]